MPNQEWLANVTRRVESLESWRTATLAVDGERKASRFSRQWIVGLAFTVINTLVMLVNLWLSHK